VTVSNKKMMYCHIPIKILQPKFSLNENVSKLKNINIFYADRLSEKELNFCYSLKFEKWVNVEKRPTEMMDILDACDVSFYSNISYLWKILQLNQFLHQQFRAPFQH